MNLKVWVGLTMVLFFYVVGLFSSWIAPYDLKDANIRYALCPPMKVSWSSEKKMFFTYIWERDVDINSGRMWRLNKSRKVYLRRKSFFIPWKWEPIGGEDIRVYLLGADKLGRDIFSTTIFGIRITLFFATLVAGLILMIALFVGMVAGYFGKVADIVLMRFGDLVMMVPGFYLLMALRSGLPLGMNDIKVLFMVAGLIVLLGWPSLARAIRAEVMSISKMEFISSARMMGLGNRQILVRYVLLYMLPYIASVFTMTIAGCILLESGLSVLGLGLSGEYVSLGTILKDSMNIVAIARFPYLLVPGCVLWLMILGFYLLGDGIRDGFLSDVTL